MAKGKERPGPWWNYRVFVYQTPTGEGDTEAEYTVHEAYYKAGADPDEPYAYSEIGVYGSSVEEARQDLDLMLEAFNRPVLDRDKIFPLFTEKEKE